MRAILNKYRILRIRPRIHYTWFLAIVLITVAIVTHFSLAHPLIQSVIVGLATSLLFLITIGAREFVLNFIATRKGIRVESVILFAFGGLPNEDRNTTAPVLELLLAISGALLNLVIAGVFSAIYFALMDTGHILVDMLVQWLAFIWLTMAIFHFVPGFPLDAGRALRALLWKITSDYGKATRIAGWTGWGIGVTLTIGGIPLLVVAQEWFTGILLIAVGFILQNAATHSRRQVVSSNIPIAQQQNG